jgi:putative transposase
METRIIQKTFLYRLNPNSEQETQFRQFAGCRRYIWNWALLRKQQHYKQTGKSLSYLKLAAELTRLKHMPATSWLASADSQCLQQALRDLERAFLNFFEKRARYPRRKKKGKTPNSFRIPQRVKVTGSQVSIPKVGQVPLLLHREIEGEVKSATIKQEPSGHWNISFVCHVEMPAMWRCLLSNPRPVNILSGWTLAWRPLSPSLPARRSRRLASIVKVRSS